MTNKNIRQILYEKSAGYRPDALGVFHSEKLQGKCKLNVLQGLVIEQPVQFCPLCRGVAVLVLHGDAVDGNGRAVRKSGFHPVGVHVVAAGKQFVHKETSFYIKVMSVRLSKSLP